MSRNNSVTPKAKKQKPQGHPVPSTATVKQLYAMAVECAYPECAEPLYRERPDMTPILNSRVAHIRARSQGGARWDESMLPKDNADVSNLILLCEMHHSEIDAMPGAEMDFPVDMLREWKATQLERYRTARRSPSLSDEQVRDVAIASFGLDAVTAAVASLLPPSERTRDRAVLLERAAREADSRRRVRLLPAPKETHDRLITWMSAPHEDLPDVPPGCLLVLTGPTGRGKTERAAQWWDAGLLDAHLSPATHIPLWLDAREADQYGFKTLVVKALGDDPDGPCRVVLDGLDRIPAPRAAALLLGVREYASASGLLSVMATAWPGRWGTSDEQIEIQPWATGKGAELFRLTTGRDLPNRRSGESEEVLATPLSTLAAAASVLAGHGAGTSAAQLLRDLAANVIERQRPDGDSVELWSELYRLARMTIDQHGSVHAAEFGDEARCWRVTSNGLAVRRGDRLSFALPVLELHFAAESVRTGAVSVESVVGSDAFAWWRYAILFAVSPWEGGVDQSLMLRLASANPVAFSWVLEEMAPQRMRSLGFPGNTPPSRIVTVEEMRAAIQGIRDGFGDLGKLLYPRVAGEVQQWGAYQPEGQREPAAGSVAGDLAATADWPPTPEPMTAPGTRVTLFSVPKANVGCWLWAREQLKPALRDIVQHQRLEVAADSPIGRERIWTLARSITRSAPRPGRDVLETADVRDALGPEPAYGTSVLRLGGPSAEDLAWLREALDQTEATQLQHPRPATDRPAAHPRSLIDSWRCYSPELTCTVVAQVLKNAVTGYQDMVELNLSSSRSALDLYAMLPVCIVAHVVWPSDVSQVGQLTYRFERDRRPGVDARSPQVEVTLAATLGEATWQPTNDWFRTRRSLNERRHHNIALPTAQPRAVTNLAYRWLADDLAAVGWVTPGINFS